MIDLNLFRVFDAIMGYRSVRRAGEALSITPSAVSHALNRLRQAIGDELFTPSQSGMQPTQRARELASAVREGFEKLELALSGQDSAPAEAPRTLRIVATDYACVVLLPPLVKRLVKSAPHLDLQVVSSNYIDAVQQLEENQTDLVIGAFTKLPASVCRKTLLRENEVIVVRGHHPLTRGKVTGEKLGQFPHVVVRLLEENPDRTRRQSGSYVVPIESALQEFQQRTICPAGRATVTVPNFAAVISFLQLSDMVAIVPHRLALWAAAHAPLFLVDPPYPAVTIELEMLWSRASDEDPAICRLLNELIAAVGDLD